MSARLREALELVLLFHSSGPWGDAKADRWREITGRYLPLKDGPTVTTAALCDHIRKVLAEPEPPVRCARCGCFAGHHAIDNKALRECTHCTRCQQFEAPT